MSDEHGYRQYLVTPEQWAEIDRFDGEGSLDGFVYDGYTFHNDGTVTPDLTGAPLHVLELAAMVSPEALR